MTTGEGYKALERLRWGGKPVCPFCHTPEPYFLAAKTTTARRGSERRIWKCRSCRKQFTALTGTPFHRSKLPAEKILAAMSDFYNTDISGRQVALKHGINEITVSRVRKRLGVKRPKRKSSPLPIMFWDSQRSEWRKPHVKAPPLPKE